MKEINPIKSSLWQNGICISEGIPELLTSNIYSGSDWGVVDPSDSIYNNESPQQMYYASSPDKLKCTCYVCDKEISPSSQYRDYTTDKYLINIDCHGDHETVRLTDDEIKTVNEQGSWVAFMK